MRFEEGEYENLLETLNKIQNLKTKTQNRLKFKQLIERIKITEQIANEHLKLAETITNHPLDYQEAGKHYEKAAQLLISTERILLEKENKSNYTSQLLTNAAYAYEKAGKLQRNNNLIKKSKELSEKAKNYKE